MKIRIILILSAVCLAGCGEIIDPNQPQGFIQVKGSDTIVNASQMVSEEFMKGYPHIFVAITGGGSGVGIARVLILKPQVILLDEPCSALDPIATLRIEELLRVLRQEYSVAIVTHNMQQAARVSDYTGFMYLGKLIEFGDTNQVFTNPRDKLTEDYISGHFG